MIDVRTTAIAAMCLGLAACSQAEAQQAAHSGMHDMQAMQVMLDRIAIEDMVVEYYAHLGGSEAGAFGDYFTEDAVFDVNGIVATGREEIEAIYAGMREDGGESLAEQGTFHMLLSNPVIEEEGDIATASFIWTGVLNTSIDERPVLAEQGREYDRLVKRDGKWLFTHRVVIADSALPESMRATYTPRRDFRFED